MFYMVGILLIVEGGTSSTHEMVEASSHLDAANIRLRKWYDSPWLSEVDTQPILKEELTPPLGIEESVWEGEDVKFVHREQLRISINARPDYEPRQH